MSRRVVGFLALGLMLAVVVVLWSRQQNRASREQALREAVELLRKGDIENAELLLAPYVSDDLRAVHLQAQILEARDDKAGQEALLTPWLESLGSGEGARVLGLLWLRRGELEAAEPLLQGYLDVRLKRVREARAQLQSARSLELEKLLAERTNEGPSDSLALSTEVERRLAAQPAMAALFQASSGEQALVPLIVELVLTRMQAPSTLSARERLAQAHETLLAVADLAGSSKSYLMLLGQISYALGKVDAGRAAVEKLVGAFPDDFALHLQLAGLLQSSGEETRALVLLEQAWEGSDDPALKQHAAQQRAHASVSLDEKIAWLQRADLESPLVECSLAQARGEKAEQEGAWDEAEASYREALEVSRTLPDAAGRNSQVRALLAIVRLKPGSEAVAEIMRLFEEALSHSPQQVEMLREAAFTLREVALTELLGPLLAGAPPSSPRTAQLAFLYRTNDERSQLLARLRSSPALARALAVFEQLLQISPGDPTSYAAAGLYATLGDVEALQRAAESSAAAERVGAGQQGGLAAFFASSSLQAELPQLDSRVISLRSGLDGARTPEQKALLLGSLVQVQLRRSQLGQAVDADTLVVLAQRCNAESPSLGSQRTLVRALLFRCAQNFPGDALQALGAQHYLAWYATHQPTQRSALAGDPDLLAALDLMRELRASFPEQSKLWEWALLHALQPDQATAVADSIRAHTAGQLQRQIDAWRAPNSVSTRLEEYWWLLLQGQADEAAAAYEAGRAAGVALPALP